MRRELQDGFIAITENVRVNQKAVIQAVKYKSRSTDKECRTFCYDTNYEVDLKTQKTGKELECITHEETERCYFHVAANIKSPSKEETNRVQELRMYQ
jgi:hypothetical protein